VYRIIQAQFIAPEIKQFLIEAPQIALRRKPGQFVIVRTHERGERIPLTIVDADPELGTITLIVQGIGKSTKQLNQLDSGCSIQDIVGPLGKPSNIENFGTAVVIGGGVGTAIAYPTAVALKRAGNHVIAIIGARNKDLLILETQMRNVAHELDITTDDGSYGEHAVVTKPLQRRMEGGRIDFVIAIGPIRMMQSVAEVTRGQGIHTVVSLNPVMVDGTGMCGGCRAVVNQKSVFVCVDGPEFDAHLVDFDLLIKRNLAYRKQEQIALHQFTCKTETALATIQH
jgi:ferredoxin--NADP+ reductase